MNGGPLAGGEHVVVVDLGYGDAGKGTVVDWLCAGGPANRRVSAVVRFNGGAQAAHNVVGTDGRHHTFAQFGAGTLHGVPTHLSRFMVVDPLALAAEADHLAWLGVPDPLRLLSVDAEALLTTPWHRAANQARERRRGGDRHGSCGMGVGETMAFAVDHPDVAPRVGDALAPQRLLRKFQLVRDALVDELGPLDVPDVADVADAFEAFGQSVSIVDSEALQRLLRRGRCVFEGAQGVLLDEWHGWHPYTTWSTTTFANAEALLAGEPATRLGVLRAYTTRHGPGPLVTEDHALGAALPDPHNGHGPWQGAFRVGHFDAVAHRYALEVAGGVDGLAITHLDVPDRVPALGLCETYQLDGRPWDRITPGVRGDLAYQEKLTGRLLRAAPAALIRPDDWAGAIGATLDAPVLLRSFGPTAADKRF